MDLQIEFFDDQDDYERCHKIGLGELEGRIDNLHQMKIDLIQEINSKSDIFNPESQRKLHRRLKYIKAILSIAKIVYNERKEERKAVYGVSLRQEFEQSSIQKVKDRRKQLKSQVIEVQKQLVLGKAAFEVSRIPQPGTPRLVREQENIQIQREILAEIVKEKQAQNQPQGQQQQAKTKQVDGKLQRYQRELSAQHYKQQCLLGIIRALSHEIQPQIFRDCLDKAIAEWLKKVEGYQLTDGLEIETDLIPFLHYLRKVLKDQLSED